MITAHIEPNTCPNFVQSLLVDGNTVTVNVSDDFNFDCCNMSGWNGKNHYNGLTFTVWKDEQDVHLVNVIIENVPENFFQHSGYVNSTCVQTVFTDSANNLFATEYQED